MNTNPKTHARVLLMLVVLAPAALGGAVGEEPTVCVTADAVPSLDRAGDIVEGGGDGGEVGEQVCVDDIYLPVGCIISTNATNTTWTHYHDGTEGASGTHQPAVTVPNPPGNWFDIPSADYVWKDLAQAQTTLPVMFEEVFRGCGNATGLLQINADNSFLVVFNDEYVGHCGSLNYSQDDSGVSTSAGNFYLHSVCFDAMHQFPLVMNPSGNNHLVIYVWNQGGPAMVQYNMMY